MKIKLTSGLLAAACVALLGTILRAGDDAETSRALTVVPAERRFALIIGVDEFPNLPTKAANDAYLEEHPILTTEPDSAEAVRLRQEAPSERHALRCCAKDARDLAAALEQRAGFPSENIVLMTFEKGDDVRDPLAPTAENVERELRKLAGKLGERDMLLVSFSGHGVMFETETSGRRERKSYLCPCDADLSRLSSFVDRSKLLETLKRCRAERKVFIADACRDPVELAEGAESKSAFGGRSRSMADPFDLGDFGFAQLSSCREKQCSLEDDGNGLFIGALIEALETAANDDGELTLNAWFDAAQKTTIERSRRILALKPELGYQSRQKYQEPMLYLEGETPRWVFANRLPVDGLPWATWEEADALYFEACNLRKRRDLAKARAKIAAALEQTENADERSGRRARYLSEAARIDGLVKEEAETAANDAWTAFNKGGVANVKEAVALMKKSLKLVDSASNRNALALFEAKLKELQTPKPPTVTPPQPKPESEPSPQTQGQAQTGGSSSENSDVAWDAASEAGTRKTLTVDGVEYAFRYCPSGTFQMGSPTSETYRFSNETQHRVELTNGFWMLETEVTQAMWKSLMGSNPSFISSSGSGWSKVSGMDTSNFPVDSVSWTDCQEFIKKLNSLGVAPSGFQFRLPSEAEWEYACRAGTTTAYFWGSSLNGDKANCDGNNPYGTFAKGKFLRRTTEVGSYDPNGWGLYDMHGNVCEWCEDTFVAYDTSNNVQNPINVTTGSYRVLRSG
ncbi:MAG: SUMF1/EgtB/PvdO family nonheme iron enzyme, partial [Thermoguttaceae bacterium]|nr:SUMF1/EgtB/PvdO family nonheme iron enzyme [Thermoguttaceae bacterium]